MEQGWELGSSEDSGLSAHACPLLCELAAVLGTQASPFPVSFMLFCPCLVDSHVHTLGCVSKDPASAVLELGLELTASGSVDGSRNHSSSTSGFGQL